MKSEIAAKLDVAKVADGLFKVKLGGGRGLLKVGVEKRHGEASSLFLELGGSRKFEIGNDCDTCHFWFKCLSEPDLSAQKKIINLPKTIQLPRPLDESMVHEMEPLFDLFEKGEYYLFETSVALAGPYDSDDEGSYFFNNEFMEIWDIENPKEEGLLPEWEHYEGNRPRIFQHPDVGILEKQFDFIVPMVPRANLKEEYVKLYQEMIANGDRPRLLAFGLYQRAIPESVRRGQIKNLHSFMAGYVLDGHHKLAAYRRAGVPVKLLVVLSLKASKYALLKDEGANSRQRLEERLSSLVAA